MYVLNIAQSSLFGMKAYRVCTMKQVHHTLGTLNAFILNTLHVKRNFDNLIIIPPWPVLKLIKGTIITYNHKKTILDNNSTIESNNYTT